MIDTLNLPLEICDIIDDYYDEHKYIFPWCLEMPIASMKCQWLESLYDFIGDTVINGRFGGCKQMVVTNVASKDSIKAIIEPTYNSAVQYKWNDNNKWEILDKQKVCKLLEKICRSKYTIYFYCTILNMHDRSLKIGNSYANITHSSYFNPFGFGEKILIVYELQIY